MSKGTVKYGTPSSRDNQCHRVSLVVLGKRQQRGVFEAIWCSGTFTDTLRFFLCYNMFNKS